MSKIKDFAIPKMQSCNVADDLEYLAWDLERARKALQEAQARLKAQEAMKAFDDQVERDIDEAIEAKNE